MLIVPQGDNLVVEAKVDPADIDQLRVGQEAMSRFSAFSQRTTPEISGTVDHISADIMINEDEGTSCYSYNDIEIIERNGIWGGKKARAAGNHKIKKPT